MCVCVIAFGRIGSAWFFCLVITTVLNVETYSTWLEGFFFFQKLFKLAAVTLVRWTDSCVYLITSRSLFGRVAIIAHQMSARGKGLRTTHYRGAMMAAACWTSTNNTVRDVYRSTQTSSIYRSHRHTHNFGAGSQRKIVALEENRFSYFFFEWGKNRQQQQSAEASVHNPPSAVDPLYPRNQTIKIQQWIAFFPEF